MGESLSITAVLPCYNHERYLRERIESVLLQTHSVDEIIFLDDASSDSSILSAKRFLSGCSVKVNYIRNSCNSGSPFAQWNLGIRHAKGDLIWIAETDDVCDNTLIQKLYTAVSNSDAVLAFSQSRYIDELSNDLGSALSYTDSVWPGEFTSSFMTNGVEFRNKYMGTLNAIPNASAVLFRKEAYIQSGFANESMHFAGDWDIWNRLMSLGPVYYIPEELNLFRCHSSTTRAKGRTAKAAAEVLACRLYVVIKYITPAPSQFTLFVMKAALGNPIIKDITIKAFSSLDWSILTDTRKAYKKLARVVSIGDNVWVLLGIVYFFQFYLRYLAAMPGKVKRRLRQS